jgi:uncharacterized protein (DUF58 family)
MRPTSRFHHVGAAAAVLAGVGLLAQSAPAVVGGLVLGCWLLVSQFTALEEFQKTTEQLTVELTPVQNVVTVEQEFSVTAEASLTAPARSPVTVTVALPTGAELTSDIDPTCRLEPGETDASTTFRCSFPIAGEFAFPPMSIDLVDHRGTVTETLTRDPKETIRVDPREPHNIHIGQGGERVTAYGEHSAGQDTSGIVPAETRQYMAGDALRQIDWKATARMQSPHVREFEGETDRQTIIAIDHSQVMAQGPDGQTMLDYAREVALGFARAAESVDDPLGLYAIGDHGITTQQLPTSAPRGYQHIRNALYGLSPTNAEGTKRGAKNAGDSLTRPQDARAAARALANEDSPFAQTVAPFLENSEAYVHRIESDPLFRGIERLFAETTGEVWLILLTADTGRNRLRDIASLAANNGGSLSLFLTPRVLFDAGAMDDLNQAYERYASFETFRRTVGGNQRTNVFELGPGDRLEALLTARRRVRQ